MPDMIMDAGDGTQRVIESDAIRALVGFVEQRDGRADDYVSTGDPADDHMIEGIPADSPYQDVIE